MTGFDDLYNSFQWSQNIHRSMDLGFKLSQAFGNHNFIQKHIGLDMLNAINKISRIHTPIINSNDWHVTKSSLTPHLNLNENILSSIASIDFVHKKVFGDVFALTESMRLYSPAIGQAQMMNNVLKSINTDFASIVARDKSWQYIEDFSRFTQQAHEFAESLSEDVTEEEKMQFQVLLQLAKAFFTKHKKLGIGALVVIDILLRITDFHQYYDFLQSKPDPATKEQVTHVGIKQDSTLYFIKALNEQFRESKEYRITNRPCAVKLKPKSKTTTISKLPIEYEVTILQTHHKWMYVSYFDPIDNLPQTGWIMKKYLDKP